MRDDGLGAGRNLLDGVGDVDRRQRQLPAQAIEVGQDVLPPGDVDRGERLVEQQQARAGHQRPAERDALAFAARQPRRAPGQQRVEVEHRHDRATRQPALVHAA